MIEGLTIERIPRLTRPVLEELIVRCSPSPIQPACYRCHQPCQPIHRAGEILCESCAEFKRLGIRTR